MKNILYFLLLFSLGCKSKQIVLVEGIPTRKLEPGKCYSSVKLSEKEKFTTEEKQPFLLEIRPPIFKTKKVKINEDELIDWNSNDSIVVYPISIRPYSLKFKFLNEELADWVSINEPEGFLFCLIEIPEKIKTFTEDELNKRNFILEKLILKRPPQIVKRYVKRKPKRLKENQYYFEAGHYAHIREAMKTHRDNFGMVLKLKTKLIELGYELKKDGLWNEKTKAAVIDFQNKNGLSGRKLDYDTLKKLGIEY